MKVLVLLIVTVSSSSIRYRKFFKHHKQETKPQKEQVGRNLIGSEQVRQLLKSEQLKYWLPGRVQSHNRSLASRPIMLNREQIDLKKTLHEPTYNKAKLGGKRFLGKYDLRPQSAIFSYLNN